VECSLPAWDVQMKEIVNCRNISVKDNEEDPKKITNHESKVHLVVVGPIIESVDVTKSLNIIQVNIGLE